MISIRSLALTAGIFGAVTGVGSCMVVNLNWKCKWSS